MGYNNHHAGMHLIWFPRHFVDWSYDRSIEEQWRVKQIDNKKISKPEASTVPSNAEKDALKTSSGKQINNKHNKKNKRKSRTMRNSDDNKYGKEFVINKDYFYDTDIVARNIIYIALKNKKDIFTIFKEADELMEKDVRTNPAPNSDWYGYPLLNKTMVYMKIIADRLDCNYREFFLDNTELIRKFVYKMLDDISFDKWEGDIDEDGNAEIRLFRFDRDYLGISGITGLEELHELNKYGTMDLILNKGYDEGIAYYSVAYGNLYFKPRNNNIIWGAYLMEEKEGKVKDLVEKLIEMNPDWVY